MAEASDFKFGVQLGFAKAHHEIIPGGKSGRGLGLGKLSKILWFHFNIYTMAEASNFKFGMQLGLAKDNHENHTQKKMGVALVREAPIYLGIAFNISATTALSS